MAKREYIETTCKSAINRVSGMPFKWSLNPYRGCAHACHYCYARASHTYYGMNADEDFESRIVVKTNFAEVLRKELGKRSWTGEQIALGTATDAYQPAEGRYRITRGVVQAMLDYRNPMSIVTKSTLIQRDLDLLSELARVADVRIYVTITTLDPDLWRVIEPGTPPPHKRLVAVQKLNAAGVTAGVFMAPILPGITDSADSIHAVAAAARDHDAASFGTGVLRLAPFVREHYLGFIQEAFPHLLARYERAFVGVNAPADYVTAIKARIDRIRSQYGFGDDAAREGRYQMALGRGKTPPSSPQQQLALPLMEGSTGRV